MIFRDVELELVRPGPPHNQLLSPLTQYIALCGESSPITFRIDFEHRRLLTRLEQLRYKERADSRQRALAELGEDIGNLLAEIASLSTEISNARRDNYSSDEPSEVVHLRIVLSGSELSLLPYEVSIAPQAMPGEGIGMLLQGRVPIIPTREIRRSRPLTTRLDRIKRVKVLYAYATPPGYSAVPSNEHLAALRRALDPWIGPPGPVATSAPDEPAPDGDPDATPRLDEVKKYLRVLPEATLDDIYEICSQEQFTHVHILGHGALFKEAGEEQFGIALRSSRTPDRADVVSGQRLAHALGAESDDGSTRNAPFWVTLATCDGGNQQTVMVPGGSLAHDLHAHGVPWVLASQFPLSKSGSVVMAEFLYPRLFRGDDPRQVLYELRRYLFLHQVNYHDWASLVVYASVPVDFDAHVAEFFEQATQESIEALMRNADAWAEARRRNESPRDTFGSSSDVAEFDARIREALAEIEPLFERWEQRLPPCDTMPHRVNRTNFYGMQGSIEKRLGLLKSTLPGRQEDPNRADEAKAHFHTALDSYRKAMDQWATEQGKYNWVASQYLSLRAILHNEVDAEVNATCRTVAERDTRSDDVSDRAWAHASLAELELLRLADESESKNFEDITAKIQEHCRQVVDLSPTKFHVESTLRQFSRYADSWGLSGLDVTGRMVTAAGMAVDILSDT